jgi:hypothetical protein
VNSYDDRKIPGDKPSTTTNKTSSSASDSLNSGDALQIVQEHRNPRPINDGFAIVGENLMLGSYDEVKNHPKTLIENVGLGIALGATSTAAIIGLGLATPEIVLGGAALTAGYGLLEAGKLIKDAEKLDYAGTDRRPSRFGGESYQSDAKPTEEQLTAITKDAKSTGISAVYVASLLSGAGLGSSAVVALGGCVAFDSLSLVRPFKLSGQPEERLENALLNAGRWKWSDEAHRPGTIALSPYYSITQRPDSPTLALPKLGGNAAYGKIDNGI